MNETLFRELLDNYITGKISRAEQDQFFQLLEEPSYREILKQVLKDNWENIDPDVEDNPRLAKLIEQNVLAGIDRKTAPLSRPILFFRRYRMAAAAILLLVVAITAWLMSGKNEKAITDQIDGGKSLVEIDIEPGANGAILTLDNGQQIVLDSLSNGLIAKQGSTRILKGANGLSYQSGAKVSEVVYNTLTTPRGRQYPNLILADGSKVWLDAGSSIRFPTAFTGNERKVWVTGQVWFEVANNSGSPFKVMANGVEITDLGTQFNVNAYEDEEAMKVTLIQGAVRIYDITLDPGQQATLVPGAAMKLRSNVNIGEVIAWKNGLFNFQNADIKTVMRQLSRWYDVEVNYVGNIPEQRFNGEIGRNLTLKEILEGLAFTHVRFKIEEGRKLTILP